MSSSQMYPAASMEREYPMSLGVFERCITAQHLAGYLADQGFPVQNLEIVGTERRSVERVTGAPDPRTDHGRRGLVRALDRPVRRAGGGDLTPATRPSAHRRRQFVNRPVLTHQL